MWNFLPIQMGMNILILLQISLHAANGLLKTYRAYGVNRYLNSLSYFHGLSMSRVNTSVFPHSLCPVDGVSYPRDLAQLRGIICEAKMRKCKICVVGQGMSQNMQNVGGDNSVTVKLDRMNKVKIDPATSTAIVTGNVTFIDLEDAANKYGLSVKVRQASGIFGVLSSISTNVHGWDHKAGCIGTTVNWIRVVDENGGVLTIDREDPEFKECIGSFGTKYLMWEAEIQLTPNVLLRKEAKAFSSIKDALKEFKDNFEKADLALIRVGGSKGFATILFYPINKTPRISKNLNREPSDGPYLERLIVDISRFLIWIRMKWLLNFLYKKVVDREWKSPCVELRNEVMNINVNAIKKRFKGVFVSHKFWLVEYFMKEKYLEDFMALYKDLYKDIFVYNISIRYVPEYHDSYTSYAKTDVFSVVICWDQKLTTKEILKSQERNQRILEFLYERDGMFYLPYRNSAKDIKKFYGEFAEKVKRDDSIFSNVMIEELCRA